jgi:hypothetical protein
MSNSDSGINIIMTTSTILVINTGTSPNAGDGDTLRTAFTKINYNFALIEDQLIAGGFTGTVINIANLGDLVIIGATITSTGTNEGIVLSPNGTGTVIAQSLIEAVNGIKYPDGSVQTTAFNSSSTLKVSQVTTGTTTVYSNTVSNVTNLVFDTEAGFTVDEFGQATAFISMNSTFKYWEVNGQQTLIAVGLDTMHFIAGPGIAIITSATDVPQSIEFDVVPATTSTIGGIIAGPGLYVDETGLLTLSTSTGGILGNFLIKENTIYPNTSTGQVLIGTQNSQDGSYILMPPRDNNIDALTILGQNGLLITTPIDSTAPITISPNVNTNGPGDVQIYAQGAYDNTAGVFLASTASQVFLYPSEVLPYLITMSTGIPIGTIDLATGVGNDISIRPGGLDDTTGTVYINGSVVVKNITVTEGQYTATKTTSTTAGGVIATSGTYHAEAVELDLTVYVHRLTSDSYYLPPGIEGQHVYFVPQTGASNGTNIIVWFENIRIFEAGLAVVSPDRGWYPFYEAGLPYAIYADGAWNLSTNNII